MDNQRPDELDETSLLYMQHKQATVSPDGTISYLPKSGLEPASRDFFPTRPVSHSKLESKRVFILTADGPANPEALNIRNPHSVELGFFRATLGPNGSWQHKVEFDL